MHSCQLCKPSRGTVCSTLQRLMLTGSITDSAGAVACKMYCSYASKRGAHSSCTNADSMACDPVTWQTLRAAVYCQVSLHLKIRFLRLCSRYRCPATRHIRSPLGTSARPLSSALVRGLAPL